MNYADIKIADVANGKGVRVSLFVSGCNHHCKGCFNAQAWDFNYGKEFTEKELLERVKDCTIPFLLVRDRSTRRCYEIPDHEMLEFRAVCDPNYKGTLYVDTVTAEARPGQAVRVIRGPFAGLEGKLTQYKKSYYVVVTLATIGVMLHIPKWYCEKIN